MTTADPSALAAPPLPPHASVLEFTRLAGHARLIVAGILLLLRSTIIGLFLLIWPAVTEPSYAGAILPDQLIGVMITAALIIWCMQFLMPWQSHPIRTAALTTASILLWTSFTALLFWNEPMADRPAHLIRLAIVIIGAAAVATIAARYARLLLQPGGSLPLDPSTASAPSITRFCESCAAPLGDAETCPACGRYSPKPDLRPALQHETARMQSAWQHGLLSLRCLALLIGTLILACIAKISAGQFLHGSGNPDPVFVLVFWSFLGSLTGAALAFLCIHRPRPLASATAAGVTLLALATGAILLMLAEPPFGAINLPPLFWQAAALASAAAAGSSLFTHWLLTIIVTRFAPLASAQRMLGRKIDRPAPANLAPPPSPRTCESCGYQLEGLPATRCDKCSIVALRCPECGHTQPANTLNARALRLIYKLHTIIRTISWLGGLGLILWLSLMGSWILLIVFSLSGIPFGHHRPDWGELWGIALLSVVFVSPVRLVLLHGRRLWLISLLVALVPAAVVLLASSTAGDSSEVMWYVTVFFLPCWLVISFSIPYLWRLWMRMIFGPDIGTELFQWYRSPAYRHRSAEQILTDPDRALGREIPLQCAACSTTIPAIQATACPACGIHSLPCPACQQRHGISAVRVGLESILHRLRFAGLALLALAAAFVAVILVFADVTNGLSLLAFVWCPQPSDYAYRANSLETVAICAILFGILGGMTMIRRPPIVSAVVIALMHTLWFAVVPLAFRGEHGGAPVPTAQVAIKLLEIFLGSCILTYIVARLSRPLLRLALFCISPNLCQPLYLWITGKQTLNQAGQQLI